MITLCIRTDSPEASIAIYDDKECLISHSWQAHRELAETIHHKIEQLLKEQNKNLQDIEKIAVYEGPGSFTGLRIGVSVANALAYGLGIPAVSATGDNWIELCLVDKNTNEFVRPVYGSDPHITQQKK